MKPQIIALPNGSLVNRITSPGFSTVLPEIQNAELIPGGVRAGLESIWGASFESQNVEFHLIHDAIVIDEGLVFDRDLRLYEFSITQNTEDRIDLKHETLSAFSTIDDIEFISGNALLCGKAGLNNYGHWLSEMLPLASMLTPLLCQEQPWKLVVPQVFPQIARTIRESISLLGVDDAQCIYRSGSPVRVENLIVVTGLSAHGRYFSPLIIDELEKVSRNVPAGDADRVWVTRAGDARAVFDEEVVNTYLQANGWTIMRPMEMSFTEQIAMAKGARRIAGVNGAGLSNLLFMQAGSAITCFVPASMPDIFYWQLSGHKGLSYSEVRCRQINGDASPGSWNTLLDITGPEILASLG